MRFAFRLGSVRFKAVANTQEHFCLLRSIDHQKQFIKLFCSNFIRPWVYLIRGVCQWWQRSPEGRDICNVAFIVIKQGGDGIADVITLFDWVVAMVTSLNNVGRGNSCVTHSHYLVINMWSDKEIAADKNTRITSCKFTIYVLKSWESPNAADNGILLT